MPQPESWSSDWRMRGFSASISSCRIEAGSAATQPNTRHMTAQHLTGARFLRRGLNESMEQPIQEPKRIWWARPRKLCALERPGGGGRNHRIERRLAEIEYLRSRGVRFVVSVM